MKSKVLVRRSATYQLDAVEAFVRESLQRLFPDKPPFAAGDKILLKPNLLRGFAPERCVTTHPVVLEAVLRVLSDCSAGSVTVSDSPAFGSLESVAHTAGYGPLAQRYGLKIEPFTQPTPLKTAAGIAHLKIAGSLENFDHTINLPKFKSHCQMTLTLSIKNLFGVVIGKRKPVLHCLVKNDKVRFGEMLIAIAQKVNPTLTVVDGIQAMQGMGPANGTPYPLGILASGRDMTALDRVLTEIVQVPPEQVFALKAAHALNYGNHSLENIELLGETDLAALAVSDFKLAERPMDISFNPVRVIRSILRQFYEVRVREKRLRKAES